MTSSPAATIGFAVFMAGAGAWRIWETKRNQGAVRGQTSMRWTLHALVAGTSLVFAATTLEFFLVPRPHRLGVSLAGLALLAVAIVISMFSGISLGKKALEMVVSAMVAAALSYAFGRVLESQFGVHL